MNNRKKELLYNTIILGFGQLVPKVFSFLAVPVLTSRLSVEEFGLYDLVLSTAGFLIPLWTLQIQQAVFRYLLAANSHQERQLWISNALGYVSISSAVFLPLIFGILYNKCISNRMILWICFLYLGEVFYQILGQSVRGIGKNLQYSKGVIWYAAINFALILFFMVGNMLDLERALMALAISYLVADIYLLLYTRLFRYVSRKTVCFKEMYRLLRFSVPILPSSLSLWVVNLSDRLLILRFLGEQANGIYSVANKIPSIYGTVYQIFNLAWTESASRASGDRDAEKYYSQMLHSLIFFLTGMMLLLLIITPFLFEILAGKEYDEAYLQVPVLYAGVYIYSFVNFYSGIYLALKQTGKVGYSSAAGAFLNVTANILLIKEYGLYAASWSTVSSYLVIVLYRGWDIKKYVKIRYDGKMILISSVFFLAGAFFCSLRSMTGIAGNAVVWVAYMGLYNRFWVNRVKEGVMKWIRSWKKNR